MSDAEERLKRLERIMEISRELTSTIALEPLLHKIVDVAVDLTGSEVASILLLDRRSGELHFRATSSDSPGQLRDIPVPLDGSIAGAVHVSGEPTIVSDVRGDPRHYTSADRQTEFETRSILAVPLKVKQRRIGVLEALNKCDGGEFCQEDVETLATLGAHAAVAIENARLVMELRDAYNRLGELDRLKSDFIAIASHELRTPLALILGYASIVQENVDVQSMPEMGVVIRAASRLKQIIETMLNLRYLETGEMTVAPVRFDLRDEVRAACEAYRPITEAEGVEIETQLPGEQVSLVADQEKVRVVLDNLLSNAVKFTDPGGRVTVSVRPGQDEVEVEVSDTGSGIPSEELERVFERFYQIEDHMTRRHGGMGLGLSIVKGLVELHGGEVWANSTPDHGSRFGFKLPTECFSAEEV